MFVSPMIMEKKTNVFGEGNGFSSHLQRDSQDLSTLTQLTRLNFLNTEHVWFLSTILNNNAWPSSKLDRSLKKNAPLAYSVTIDSTDDRKLTTNTSLMVLDSQ